MVEQFCQTEQEGMCKCAEATCYNTQTHSEAETSSLCYFHVQPRTVTVQKLPAGRKRLCLGTKSQSKISKQSGEALRDWRDQKVCDNPEAPWEITGLHREGAKEEKAGRRQDWNSLTLFGGLEVFA